MSLFVVALEVRVCTYEETMLGVCNGMINSSDCLVIAVY